MDQDRRFPIAVSSLGAAAMAEPVPPRAAGIRSYACGAGCPVVALVDAGGEEIAVAHSAADVVEAFIAQLREAAALGVARRRPLA